MTDFYQEVKEGKRTLVSISGVWLFQR